MPAFTSHYVSINSRDLASMAIDEDDLHPTMYLLIPVAYKNQIAINYKFTSHYVSINSNIPTGTYS